MKPTTPRPTTEMRFQVRCPDCGNEVQIILTNPSPATRFSGPAAADNRFRFVDHFISHLDQRLCSGSGKDLPVA